MDFQNIRFLFFYKWFFISKHEECKRNTEREEIMTPAPHCWCNLTNGHRFVSLAFRLFWRDDSLTMDLLNYYSPLIPTEFRRSNCHYRLWTLVEFSRFHSWNIESFWLHCIYHRRMCANKLQLQKSTQKFTRTIFEAIAGFHMGNLRTHYNNITESNLKWKYNS